MLADVAPQIGHHPVGVPLGASQQMLQPIRAGMTGSLGQRPAVLTPQIRDQSQHQRTQCLAPGKPRRGTVENLIKPHTPAFNVYAMSRGGRG
jgi:hypothetical protein